MAHSPPCTNDGLNSRNTRLVVTHSGKYVQTTLQKASCNSKDYVVGFIYKVKTEVHAAYIYFKFTVHHCYVQTNLPPLKYTYHTYMSYCQFTIQKKL